MEQVDLLSGPSHRHVDTDVDLSPTATPLSSLLRVSLTGIGSRVKKPGTGDTVERTIGTDLFCTTTAGHDITGNLASGSVCAGRTITDVGLARSLDIDTETDLPHTDLKCAHTVLATAREAVRNGAVKAVAGLLPLIEKRMTTKNSVDGVKGYMDLLVAEAIDRRQGKVLRLLLNNGVNPGGSHQNKSHLIRAVTADDVGLAKDLLLFGADVNAREFNGKMALHAAAATSSRDVIELLLERGSDMGARDAIQSSTPLHVACTYCNRDAVLALVERGAEFNAVNSFGDTPLSKLLGPVTKSSDFHNEARVRLAEELVMVGFVLPKRSSSSRVISDPPASDVQRERSKTKFSRREVSANKKLRKPKGSHPSVLENPRNSNTNSTVSVCSFPPKRENAYRVYEQLLQRLSGSLSLKQLCRLRIRQALCHVPLKSSVTSLGLPKIVQNYIVSGDKAINTGTVIEE